MKVEVAYALPERQWLVAVEVAAGASALDALRASGLLAASAHPKGCDAVPELAAPGRPLALAVHGRKVAPERALRDGDRVEVLRPLQADPKEVRRRLAAEGRVMGRERPAQD